MLRLDRQLTGSPFFLHISKSRTNYLVLYGIFDCYQLGTSANCMQKFKDVSNTLHVHS